MFERYTEKARRVMFFTRFEASQYGCHYIDTEHLLLGLLRENFPLMSAMIGSGISLDTVRQDIEKQVQRGERFSTAVEVPLSIESKRVLKFAAEEAERMAERHVGAELLLLGLLREENALHTEQTPRSVLRMTIVLLPEKDRWTILLVQVVPVIP
jgi:ATP-dependent Clp protease ATP-binding subunit ClpC